MDNPNKEFSDEDLLDNMGDMLEDIVIHINTKDAKSIGIINGHLPALQNKLVDSCKETLDSGEWDQDDLIDLASAAMLLATSMGVPPADEKEPDSETTTE